MFRWITKLFELFDTSDYDRRCEEERQRKIEWEDAITARVREVMREQDRAEEAGHVYDLPRSERKMMARILATGEVVGERRTPR